MKEKKIISFAPIVDSKTRVLILGTMPSVKSLTFEEYYGNRQNQFWKILFEVYEMPYMDDYADKVTWLLQQGLGLWDVLSTCYRAGSMDSAIREEEPNDVKSLLELFPNIKVIVFSSKTAAAFFFKYNTKFEGLTFVTLPSPSGAYASLPIADKIEKWKVIQHL